MNFSIQSVYNWYRDLLRNPKYRWWVIGASVVYIVSPLDISPDVFPIVGWLDDGILRAWHRSVADLGAADHTELGVALGPMAYRSICFDRRHDPIKPTGVASLAPEGRPRF